MIRGKLFRMKRLLGLALFIFVFLIAFVYPLSPQLAQGSALTFTVYVSSAPNRHTSAGSPAANAYELWVDRALTSAEGSGGNIGNPANDPAAFRVIGDLVLRDLMVTSNPSWRGSSNPTGAFANQYGNRLHWVLHVKGNGTVRFKIEDISWKLGVGTDASDWTYKRALGTKAGYTSAFNKVDCNYGWGYDWGSDNAKGGGDDTKVCSSDGSADDDDIDEFFYVGAGSGRVADLLYQNSQYPDFADYTLQEAIGYYCNYRNTQAGWQYQGAEFSIEASDSNTYTHQVQRRNVEHGLALDPTNCRPYPPPATPAPTPMPTAVTYTGEVLNAQGFKVSATYGLRSGIQFEQREASAVGVQSVIDAGFIDAVDVWGYANQDAEVCLPYTSGVLVFLDANTTPRVATPLASTIKNGFICATVNGPGLVVLVESWPEAPEPDVRDLQNCMVTATANLNFRDGPAGAIIGYTRKNWTLTAVARTDDWFKVDLHGKKGWISADYVETDGTCE